MFQEQEHASNADTRTTTSCPECTVSPSPLTTLSGPARPTRTLLDVESNVTEALEQRSAARTREYREAKNDAFQNNLVGGCLLGGAVASLTLAPPIPFEYPLANTFAALSIVLGLAAALKASRIISAASSERYRSESADQKTSTDAFDRAERRRVSPDSRHELVTAGECYLALLSDSNGAQLVARSLIGLAECVERLGCSSRESAKLIAAIDDALSEYYFDLPVQQHLARITIDNVVTLNEQLERGAERSAFARSVARLARVGFGATDDDARASATELYQIARAISPTEPVLRAEILGAAATFTDKHDLLRENIENSLREILQSIPRNTESTRIEYDLVRTILDRHAIKA